MSSSECYVYVSTRSCEDPVRTIVLCVPDASVRSVEDVQAFASASGWIDEAEFDGAVLLAPVVAGGWASAQGEPARDPQQRDPAGLPEYALRAEFEQSFTSQNRRRQHKGPAESHARGLPDGKPQQRCGQFSSYALFAGFFVHVP